MQKHVNSSFGPVAITVAAILFGAALLQGLTASQTSVAPTSLDPLQVMRDLDEKSQELNRASLAIANATWKEPVIADCVKQSQVRMAQIDADLDGAQTELKFANAQHRAFDENYDGRVRQIQSDLAIYRLAQSEVQSQRFSEIENARKLRNEDRARIGAHKEDQEEALRERQLKKRAIKETEERIASVQSAAFGALNNEKSRIANRLASADRRLASLTSERVSVSNEIESSRLLLAELRATIGAGDQTIGRLQREIAQLERAKRSLPEPRAVPEERLSVARSSNWTTTTFSAKPVSSEYVAPTPIAQFGETEPATPSRRFDPSYRPPVGEHSVRGYYRKDGTYVRPHVRTNPDSSFWNNHSSLGNVNPHTGRLGTKLPRTR